MMGHTKWSAADPFGGLVDVEDDVINGSGGG